MKLSVNSCNLIAASVNVTTDDGCKMVVPVLYDPSNGDVFFLGNDNWENSEQFSTAIRDYMKNAVSELHAPINEEMWGQISTLKALAKPPAKK